MNPSLYVHIPFCQSKCLYCSFVSFERKDHLIDVYLKALEKEAQRHADVTVETVYIGGGTPTYLSIQQIEYLFSILRSNFKIPSNAEVTIEANPVTFDLIIAQRLCALGINRVSLGVQSLNDENLKFLGRPHYRDEAIVAFKTLRQAGFKNINIDMIYSLPTQTKKNIQEDVESLKPERFHFSYSEKK